MTDLLTNDRAWALYYRDRMSFDQIATALNCDPSELKPIAAPIKIVVDQAIATSVMLRAGLQAQSTEIERQRHEIAEQDKLLTNLTDALDDLTGRKKAEAAAAKKAAAARFKFGKNPNYLQSVGIALKEGIWMAPLSLVRTMKMPVVAFLGGALSIPVTLIVCIALSLATVGAGLIGRVSPPKIAES